MTMFVEYRTKYYTIGISKEWQRGYFEHNQLGEKIGGDLLFEDNVLVEYDGVDSLPDEVKEGIKAMGFNPNIKDSHDES